MKKNFSTDLLKQIINARIDEIIEMVIFDSNYMKNLNPKIKLVTTGGGSSLFSNNETLIKKKSTVTYSEWNWFKYLWGRY